MTFEGKVVYCRPEEDGRDFSVGFQFMDLKDEARGHLESFIGSLGRW